jgi:hypothetical protein
MSEMMGMPGELLFERCAASSAPWIAAQLSIPIRSAHKSKGPSSTASRVCSAGLPVDPAQLKRA